MKFVPASALALAGLASASPVPGPFSNPTELVIKSSNSELDGKSLSACHSGAATESLCIRDRGTIFKFNTTEGATSPLSGYNPPGLLTFELPIADAGNVSEPLSLTFDPSTNLAGAFFNPSNAAQTLAFSIHSELGILTYVEKGQVLPAQKPHFLNSWYVCDNIYKQQAVSWLVGNGQPFNPSCEKVQIYKAKA